MTEPLKRIFASWQSLRMTINFSAPVFAGCRIGGRMCSECSRQGKHRACFAKMGRGIWFPLTNREFDVKHFCQETYALLLWRMFWEEIDIPQRLFSRQLLLLQPEMDFSTEWMPANIPQEASLRLFGLECLRTYRRCLELGAQMQNKDQITFPMWRLTSHRTGEWLIELPKAGTGYKIHWWWPKRWQHTLTFPAHNTTTTNKPAASSFWIAC